MIVIVNKVIPFKRFTAINLFGVVFARKDRWDKISDLQKSICLTHEAIHYEQGKELLWVFFYLAYFFEWLFLLVRYRNSYTAYEHISFEKEAYRHELQILYTDNRKHFSQWRRSTLF